MKNVVLWSLPILFAIFFACSKENSASSEKEILSFSIGDFKSNAEGKIDQSAKTVTLQAIEGVDVTNLVPIIKVSDKAKVSPASGVAQDFTKPVTYIVTAEDGSKQAYIVTVLPPKSSEKVITSFNFSSLKPEVVGSVDQTKKTISLRVPLGTNLKDLVPTLAFSKKATVTPVSSVTQDFSKPVVYTITAEDGTKQDYTISVEVGKNVEKKIVEFKFGLLNPVVAATINEEEKTIKAEVPAGTDITALEPSVAISNGATVTPASGVKQNFTKAVVYTVTAEDGSKQDYTVSVAVKKSSDKKITEFKFANPAVTGTVDEDKKTVSVLVPAGTDVSALEPAIVLSSKATVDPAAGVKQDFSKPVVYTVTAEDGTKQEYTITVTVEVGKSGEKKIVEFKFANPAVAGTVDEDKKTVSVLVPAGTDVSALEPAIVLSSKATVDPAAGVKQDFSKPVVYTVTAEDGAKQQYTITVTVEVGKSGEKKISEFKFANSAVTGTVDEDKKTVSVLVPAGTDVSALEPAIVLSSKATVDPAAGVKQDFSKPVVYTVTAEDGTKQEYTITVTVEVGKSGEKKISDFKFASLSNATVTIDDNAKTVIVSAPAGSDVTALAPTITLSSGATVSPAPDVKQNFTKPVEYTVTAEDGTTQVYTVTVKVEAVKSGEKKISDFKFASLSNATVTIDDNAKTVTIAAPAGSDVTALAPTITLSSGATVSPAPDVRQNFTKPVEYTVTAEDGTTQVYTVTVKVEVVKSSEKKISDFKFASVSNANVSINEDKKTISVAVPTGTDVKKLVPTITISENATVDPATGVVNDFSSPITYTVTAQDETKASYVVTVEVIKNKEAKITDFKFKSLGVGGTIDEDKKAIKLKVPFGTDVTALMPSITISSNAVVTPNTGVKMDFSSPVTYKVVSETGVMAFYTVSVEVEKFETKITSVSRTQLEPRDVLQVYGTFMKGKTSVSLVGTSTIKLSLNSETVTMLSVSIPDGVPEGNYALSVTSNDITATYNSIKIVATTKPVIERTNATKIAEGGELILYGKNLNKTTSTLTLDIYDSFRHTTVKDITVNSDGTEARIIVPSGILSSKSSDSYSITLNKYGFFESNTVSVTLVKKPEINSVDNTNIFIGDRLQVNGPSLFSDDAKIWFENKSTSNITMMSKDDISEYADAIRIGTYKLTAGKYTLHIFSYGTELVYSDELNVNLGKTVISNVPSAVWSNRTLDVTGQYIYKDIVVKIDGTVCTYDYISHKNIRVDVPKLYGKKPVIQFLVKNESGKYEVIYKKELYNND
jgi:hypothetical protein